MGSVHVRIDYSLMSNYHEALFLKYRPQKLADVLAQNSVRDTLINAIKNKKIAQAYLLIGPRGSGKTSTARILAKSLNCLQPLDGMSPTVDPCCICEHCTSIANSNSIDVVEIDAASHGGVDDARLLVEKVNLTSMAGKYKIYIIDEVHMLSKQAFNALLKVIEEPPANVVFILATTEVDAVPKTISSRCQQLRFKPIGPNDCLSRLEYVSSVEKINIDKNALKLIAEYADGALRDALSLLDQVSVFANDEQAISSQVVLDIIGSVAEEELAVLTEAILKQDSASLIGRLDLIASNGKDPALVVSDLLDYFLKVLELQSTATVPSSQYLEQVLTLAKEKSIENIELVQIIESLAELENRLKRGKGNKNLLKAWLLKITNRADIFVLRNLLARIEALETNGSRVEVAVAKAIIPKPQKIEIRSSAPIKEQPTLSHTTVASNSSEAFLDYLSPSIKGMYISSQARLLGVKSGQAIIQMPIKFKYLKSKLEARSDEILAALSKVTLDEVKNLEIEIVDQIDDTVTELLTKPTVVSTGGVNFSKLDEVASAGVNIFGGQSLD